MHAQKLRIDEPHAAGFDERGLFDTLGRYASVAIARVAPSPVPGPSLAANDD